MLEPRSYLTGRAWPAKPLRGNHLGTFSTFRDAVAQVSNARVLAGFHFRFSGDDAVTLGQRVAGYVESHLMLKAEEEED